MSIRGVCPSCDHPYTLANRFAGKTVECKECGEDFVVDSADDDERSVPKKKKADSRVKASAPPPLSSKGKTPVRRRRDEDDDDDDDDRRSRRRRPQPSSGNGKLFLVLGGIGAVVLLLLVCLVPGLFFMMRREAVVAPPIVQGPPMPPPPKQILLPPPRPKFVPPPPGPKFVPPPAVNWTFQPDAGPDLTAAPQNPAGFLQTAGGLPEIVYPCTPSTFVAVRHGQFGKEGWQVVDLQSFKQVGAINQKLELQNAALSPDGKFLAGKGKFQVNTTMANVFSAVDGRQIQAIQLDTQAANLQMIDFIENGHLLTYKTRGITGFYEVYNIETGKEVKRFTVEGLLQRKNNLALSPGRKYLAVAHKNQVDLYRPVTGERVGEIRLPIGNTQFKALAFSHDGKELACLLENFGSSSRLLTWKLTDGKPGVDHKFVKDVHTLVKNAFGYKGQIMEWTPDGSGWLLYGQLLVDYQSGAPVHTIAYDAGEFNFGARRLLGMNHVALSRRKAGQLTLAIGPLPGAEIAAAVKAARTGGGDGAAPLPDAKPGNLATARIIPTPNGVIPWTAAIDPALPTKGKLAPQPIPLRAQAADIQGILFSAGAVGQAVVLSETAPNPLAARKVYRADRFDLATCKLLGGCDLFATEKKTPQFPVPPSALLQADVSPDGARLALRRPDDPTRVDVWNLTDGKHLVSWRTDANVDAIAVLDADRVLTCGSDKLILWKIPECQAIYIANGYRGALQLSPERKYVAVASGPTLSLVETATGACKGHFDPPGGPAGAFQAGAFSRDGKEFAASLGNVGVSGAKLTRWSLDKGKWLGSCDGNLGDRPMAFMGKHLIQGSHLYDWNLKGPLWNYFMPNNPTRTGGARAAPDGRHWFVMGAPNGSLLTAQTLPDPAASALAAQVAAGQVKPAVTPGMSIQLQVNGGSEKFRAAAQNSMPKDWQAKGFKIGPGGLTVALSAQERPTGQMIAYNITKLGIPFGKSELIKLNQREVACQYIVTDAQGAVLLKNEGRYGFPGSMRFEDNKNDYERQLAEAMWRNAEAFAAFGPLPTNQFRVQGRLLSFPQTGTLKGE